MNAKDDPLLVSLMRTHPTGDVRYTPTGGIGMSGMTTRGFLAEYDQALAAAYERGYHDGYTLSARDGAR